MASRAPLPGPVPAAAIGWGSAGVLAFSMTFPATRAALPAFGVTTVGIGRAVPAAALGIVGLLAAYARGRLVLPAARQWVQLGLVAAGVVIGFPLLSALALHRTGAGHAAILVGLLPAATAVVSVLRTGERPRPVFWLAVAAGVVTVLVFAVVTGAGRPQPADLLLLGAVGAGAVGYAEGGALARLLPGWQVISWALVVGLPVVAPVAVHAVAVHPADHPTPAAWLGLAYVSVVSMFAGFVAWYRGLALGGVPRIGQLQLAQPVLTLLWAWLLLGEHITLAAGVAALAVLGATVLSQWVRGRPGAAPNPDHDLVRVPR